MSKPKKPKTFCVTVTGTKYETYEGIEAESDDDAEKVARERFKDEYGSHDRFDDIESVCEADEYDE